MDMYNLKTKVKHTSTKRILYLYFFKHIEKSIGINITCGANIINICLKKVQRMPVMRYSAKTRVNESNLAKTFEIERKILGHNTWAGAIVATANKDSWIC